MQPRWTAAVVLALTALLAHAAPAAEDASRAIDACIARLDADIDVGFERVAARCPQLARQLTSSPWARWLPAGWQDANNNLSARSLAELQRLVARESAVSGSARSPQMARLKPILAHLTLENAASDGWWARLKSWLQSLRERSVNQSRGSSLERLFGAVSLPQALIRVVSYATLGLIVLLAGYIVVNEWLAAGWRRRRAADPAQHLLQAVHAPSLSWRDVERAAPTDKARVLLELLAERLTATQRLPAASALTARELVRSARLEDAQDRERLGAVASAAEALLYSGQPASHTSLAAVIDRGRELVERLAESAASFAPHAGCA